MKKLLLLILITGNIQLAFAQRNYKTTYQPDESSQYAPYTTTKGFSASKIFVGGNLGLSFGTYTNIDVSPLMGYRFSDLFAAGINLNFNFVSDKTYPGQTQSYTILGAGVFGRIYPISHLYLQVQPEYNHYTVKIKSGGAIVGEETHGVTSLLAGGGYVQQISDKASFTIGIFYDLLQDKYSPYYQQPIFQGGINIGL